MDPAAVRAVLIESIEFMGVLDTWELVACPVLVALGDRWAGSGIGVEAEHLLTETLIRVLDASTSSAPPPLNSRPVLLTCVPDEAHSLPLSALAAALAQTRIASRMVGASLPERALHDAVRRTAPVAVLLWAHAAAPDLDALVRRLPRTRSRCRWYVGGPGWDSLALPPAVTHLTSLAQATATIADSALATTTARFGVNDDDAD